jgi:diguanylate cyclase (GGDEF)-like protein
MLFAQTAPSVEQGGEQTSGQVALTNIVDSCQISLLDNQQVVTRKTLSIGASQGHELKEGENKLLLECELYQQSIFTFSQSVLVDYSWLSDNQKLLRLSAPSPSFLLPVGESSTVFTLYIHTPRVKLFNWMPIEAFFDRSIVNNLVMGAFYGLCLVLILYVFFMGKIIGDKSFQLYSFYVLCAATFFLLQEGQLHIVLPHQAFLFSHQLYILFAGLTVMSATLFICNVTEIQLSWPKLTKHGLYPLAGLVLFMAIYSMGSPHNAVSSGVGYAMGYVTLLIMLVILLLVAIQAYRKVQMAWLVCLSLVTMVAAMIYRVLPVSEPGFMTRYALILAFAVEALVFAIVVSSRIERIKISRQQAENDANTDVLCNILNRRGWSVKTKGLLDIQRKKGGVISLLYIDIDNFKDINDTQGHEAGDKVLRIIAKIIRNQSRDTDMVGRLGGDEFVVAGYFDSKEESESIANRLSKRLSDLTLQISATTSLKTSASVGHVVFESVSQDVDQMLSLADTEMYKVKRMYKAELA